MPDLDQLKTVCLALTILSAAACAAKADPVCDLTVNLDSTDCHFPLPSRYAVVSDADMSETHPTTVMLPDGKTIYAFWDTHHGGSCGPAAVSTDAGRTWTDISDRIPKAFRDAHDTPFAFRFVDPKSGKARIRVFASYGTATKYDWRGPDERPLAEAMPSILSEDDGKTWKMLPPLGADFACVNCFSGAARLKDGSYLAVFSRGKHPNGWGDPWSVMCSRSRDGGLTWEKPRLVATAPGVNYTEPTLCSSPDGGEVCCFIGNGWGKLGSAVCRSSDGGATWTKPTGLGAPLAGSRHMAATLPDGRYVVTFRRENGVFGWMGDYKALRDGTGAGGRQIRLFHNYGNEEDCGNTGVHALKDGTVVVVSQTEYSPYRPLSSIVAMRFKPEEVEADIRNGETALSDFENWKPFERTDYRPLTSARQYGPFAQTLIYAYDPLSLMARQCGNELVFNGKADGLQRVTSGLFNEASSKSGVYSVEKFRGDRRGDAAVLVWTVVVKQDCTAKLRLYGAPVTGCWLRGNCLKPVGLSDLLVPTLVALDLKAGENDLMVLVANPFYLLGKWPPNAHDPLQVAAAISGAEFTCADAGRDLEIKLDEVSISDDIGEGL